MVNTFVPATSSGVPRDCEQGAPATAVPDVPAIGRFDPVDWIARFRDAGGRLEASETGVSLRLEPTESKRTHRIYDELGLQLRRKPPKRRVKFKLRKDRSMATGPSVTWAMDFVHGAPGQTTNDKTLPHDICLAIVRNGDRIAPDE